MPAKKREAGSRPSYSNGSGGIEMNKEHHAPLTMYLGQVQSDGTVKVAATFPNVDPGAQCPNLK